MESQSASGTHVTQAKEELFLTNFNEYWVCIKST